MNIENEVDKTLNNENDSQEHITQHSNVKQTIGVLSGKGGVGK